MGVFGIGEAICGLTDVQFIDTLKLSYRHTNVKSIKNIKSREKVILNRKFTDRLLFELHYQNLSKNRFNNRSMTS
jgi:hypothetical protein